MKRILPSPGREMFTGLSLQRTRKRKKYILLKLNMKGDREYQKDPHGQAVSHGTVILKECHSLQLPIRVMEQAYGGHAKTICMMNPTVC